MRKANMLVALAALAAFLGGSVLGAFIKPQLSNALATAPAQTQVVAQQPASRRVVERSRPVRHKRSWEHEVLIVGGSAGAGAAIGAAAKGGKGAAVGALTGGVAGLIYDLATRNR